MPMAVATGCSYGIRKCTVMPMAASSTGAQRCALRLPHAVQELVHADHVAGLQLLGFTQKG